ncbi:MAG: putative sulfate exporter family transporter [Deltaproteobacteria bacterium]|nr:MAG: putative sulfate exporter family transporter [Deltaproteobacteria bacterium]
MEENKKEEQFVTERASSSISDLWKKEDYWAIWLGFGLLILGIFLYFPQGPEGMEDKIAKANATLRAESEKAPFKTVAWYRAVDAKKKLKATGSATGKWIKKFTSKPHKWSGNPFQAFFLGDGGTAAKNEKAKPKYDEAKKAEAEALALATASEKAAETAGFKDQALNAEAVKAIDAWHSAHTKASKAKKKAGAKSYNQIFYLVGLMIFMAIFFGIGMQVMGTPFVEFVRGFVFVFLIAILAYTAASNATMKHYGIGYAAWAILFGLIISNTVGTPKWAMPAVQTEYYIKTGLVLLGAEILFGKILSIGVPGIFVAWVVTPTVLISTYLFGQKVIKIPSKTLNITISADMSVCGVSAAIATAAACRAKKEELTLAVGLSLVFTSVMMIVMPAFIKAVGIPHVLGGAWMGGTIDATGAVAAAGAFLSDRALYVAATVKMIQNVLIGIIAFCVAVYWCAKVDCVEGQKVSVMEIWHRFPKFVIGFIAASIIFSSLYGAMGKDVGYVLIDHGAIRGMSKIFRGWFFCLAFTSIGLATNFRELKEYFSGGKPLILYAFGQTLNLILTLTMAYIMFYLVFPEITAKI